MSRVIAVAALIGAFALSLPARADAPLRYLVRTDAELARMEVEVCFDAAPPALVPGLPSAAPALLDARDASGHPLSIARGRIDLSRLASGSCIRYRVDLGVALRSSRFASRFGSDLVTSAGAWLWRPPRIPERGASVRFDLPPGLRAATPWPRERDVHRLDASAFQRPTFMALGRFTSLHLTRAGAELEVVRLGDGWQLDDAGVERWLTRVVDGVSTVEGRFPVDRLLVVMAPSEGSGIGFGMVRRGGGCSVGFVVGRASSADDLEASWVAWHELSHLLLPALPQRDAWLYEGLATYYQEVLPARAGVRPARDAWSNLLAGFDRGRAMRTGASLARDAETMQQTFSFARVYWAGTAFVLEADVALRRRGSSLDEVITRAAREFRESGRAWTSERLCGLFDRITRASVLTPQRARYVEAIEFPDVEPLLQRLGVGRERGRVELREAELNGLRDAITASR